MSRQEIITRFNLLYYHDLIMAGETASKMTWMGVHTLKCPMDMWCYQEIVFRNRPDYMIECGTYLGGSALYLAHLLDQTGQGQIVTIDIRDRPGRPVHPRIRYLTGSSTSETVENDVGSDLSRAERVMVILDSDHSELHVLNELRVWSKYVTVGQYLIVEDTNVNGHPVRDDFGPGPMEAVRQFLAENNNFEVDRTQERFLVTFNPSGYLRRVR